MPTLLWRGVDEPRMELARVSVDGHGLRACGTQLGAVYELRYRLEEGRLRAAVDGGPELDIGLLDGTDFFDLGFSPLFNTLPVLRDGLTAAREYVMTWVSVPDLGVERSEQRYEPLDANTVRFRAGSFEADLVLDDAGFVVSYPGLAELVASR